MSQLQLSGYIVTLTGTVVMRIALYLAVTLILSSATAASGESYLDFSIDGGRADKTLKVSSDVFSDLELDALVVWHVAIGGGAKQKFGLEVGFELAWSQRGGSLETIRGSPVRPMRIRSEYRRSYLDFSIPVRRGWRLGATTIFVGASPRASRVLDEVHPFISNAEPQDWVFGIDPAIRIAYSLGYVWTRYYWDLSPSYDVRGSKAWDRALYFGLGLRVP